MQYQVVIVRIESAPTPAGFYQATRLSKAINPEVFSVPAAGPGVLVISESGDTTLQKGDLIVGSPISITSDGKAVIGIK